MTVPTVRSSLKQGTSTATRGSLHPLRFSFGIAIPVGEGWPLLWRDLVEHLLSVGEELPVAPRPGARLDAVAHALRAPVRNHDIAHRRGTRSGLQAVALRPDVAILHTGEIADGVIGRHHLAC